MEHTTEVSVILLPATTAGVLGISSPVGHAAELVALGVGSIWNTVEGRLSGDGGTPGRTQIGERLDQIDKGRLARFVLRHDVCCFLLLGQKTKKKPTLNK